MKPQLLVSTDLWHTPVSYTHLDVYKRQERESVCVCQSEYEGLCE